MAPPQELIFSSSSSFASPSGSSSASTKRATFAPITSSSSSSSGPVYASSITLHDLATSSLVHTFKPSTGTSLHGLASINSSKGKGGLVFGAQEGKALLHVWAWQKDQLHLKLHLPEKLSCFEVSPNGIWAAGGTQAGHVYLWEIASGLLLASFDAAYRKINVIKFDDSSAVLVCGSEDSSVSAWSVSRLVDNALSNTIPQPYASFTHHTLSITSLHISHGSFPHCRVYTTSLDGTLKIFSLDSPSTSTSSSSSLLSSFTMPGGQVPTCIAVDPMERFVYVGTSKGEVHLVKLYRRRREMGRGTEEEEGEETGNPFGKVGEGDLADQVVAVGGGGMASESLAVGQDPTTLSKGKGRISVGTHITSIAISMSLTHLLTGTSSGEIHLHALPSHTLLRTIPTHNGTPVTHLSTMVRPADLVGHMSMASLTGAGGSGGNKAEDWPLMECRAFERMRMGKKERESQEIGLLLGPVDGEFDELDGLDTGGYLEEESGLKAVVGSMEGTSSQEAAKAEDKVIALEAEVARLKGQLKRAKEINDTMWSGVIEKAVKGQGKAVNGGERKGEEQDTEEDDDIIMID